MNDTTLERSESVLKNLGGLLPDLESVYKEIHAHPELSMQERRTADLAAKRLRAAGYEVTTGVGKTGVVGLLRNGEGPAYRSGVVRQFTPSIALGRGLVRNVDPRDRTLFHCAKYVGSLANIAHTATWAP